MQRARGGTAVPWLVSAAFLAPALWAARDAGMPFDSHLCLPYGDALLRYVTGRGPWPLTAYTQDFVEVYGSLALLGAAAASAVVHDGLGLVSGLVGHHLICALSGVALVGVTARLAADLFGTRVAVLAAVLLATTPRFFAEVGNGISDLPAAAAWTAAVWGVARAVAEQRLAPLVPAAVASGALAAIRFPNLVFLPVLLLLWLTLDGASRRGAASLLRASGPWRLAAVSALALGCVWLFRPLAWSAPGVVLEGIFDGIVHPRWSKGVVNIYYGGQVMRGGPRSYQAVMLGVTTPLPVLAVAAVGAVHAWRRQRSAACLLVAWLAVSVGRYAVLGLGNYDGVRHVMEGFPPLAILAGAGADAVLGAIARERWRPAVFAVGASLLAAPGAVAIWRLHPYPVVYYNALVGGVRGASGSYEVEYSGAVYGEGVEWAAAHVGARDVVWVPRAYERRLVEVEATYLGLDEKFRVWRDEAEELPPEVRSEGGRVFAMQRLSAGLKEMRPGGLDLATLPVVYEVRRDGVPLLRVRAVPVEALGAAR